MWAGCVLGTVLLMTSSTLAQASSPASDTTTSWMRKFARRPYYWEASTLASSTLTLSCRSPLTLSFSSITLRNWVISALSSFISAIRSSGYRALFIFDTTSVSPSNSSTRRVKVACESSSALLLPSLGFALGRNAETSNKPRRHWQVVETRWNFETLTGILIIDGLAFDPGIRRVSS